jgi:endonuclease/exonuclease/phosphatase family metal-dependent hydrolase
MSVNNGQGRYHPEKRWQRFSDYCQEARPDIIAVQEVSVDAGLTALNGLAQRLGYPEPLSQPVYPTQEDEQVVSVLSNLEVAEHYQLWRRAGRVGAQVVEFGKPDDVKLKLANLHMECRPWPDAYRCRKLGSIIRHLGGHKPGIMTGDFNALHWYPSIRTVKRHFKSAHTAANGREPSYTYPTELGENLIHEGDAHAWEIKALRLGGRVWCHRRGASGLLRYTVDYTFVNRVVEIVSARTIGDGDDGSFSDHLGLETEFELGDSLEIT